MSASPSLISFRSLLWEPFGWKLAPCATPQVIASLASPKEADHIPYRESKLTSLLKQCAGAGSGASRSLGRCWARSSL